jgi:NAD(P)-dependent dehydrogenase (short-subunit alcohol dehydrogenase family)
MADGLGELRLLKLARKQTRNHMATKVCFINSATRGIGAQIAKAPLADGNRFAAIDRKSGSRTPRPSDNLHPGAPELARKGQLEMAAPLPIIAVAFTVGGPVVYERRGDQFAYHETND